MLAPQTILAAAWHTQAGRVWACMHLPVRRFRCTDLMHLCMHRLCDQHPSKHNVLSNMLAAQPEVYVVCHAIKGACKRPLPAQYIFMYRCKALYWL